MKDESNVIDGHFTEVTETQTPEVIDPPKSLAIPLDAQSDYGEVDERRREAWRHFLSKTPLQAAKDLVASIESGEWPMDGFVMIGARFDPEDPNTFEVNKLQCGLNDQQIIFLIDYLKRMIQSQYIGVK